MGVVARVLEVQPGINTVLESVRKCALLSSHTQGNIETVSVHQLRREVFKDLCLRDTSTGRSQFDVLPCYDMIVIIIVCTSWM